jgi:hypothetical protein
LPCGDGLCRAVEIATIVLKFSGVQMLLFFCALGSSY